MACDMRLRHIRSRDYSIENFSGKRFSFIDKLVTKHKCGVPSDTRRYEWSNEWDPFRHLLRCCPFGDLFQESHYAFFGENLRCELRDLCQERRHSSWSQ